MLNDLLKKACANRIAAIQHVAERKTNLVNLEEFRRAVERTDAPVPGFVSSRTAFLAEQLAA